MDVQFLDSNFEVVKILDVYESLIWTERYDECGDFEIVVPASAEVFDYAKLDYYVSVPLSNRYMIVESVKIDSDPEDGDTMTISGRSLEAILDRRISWGQTILKGTLSEAVSQILSETIVNPTDEARKIPNFVFYSPINFDMEVNAQYNGDSVYDIIQGLCSTNKIGFRLDFQNGIFIFQLFSGMDHSADQEDNDIVIFSPRFENITNSSYTLSSEEYKNVAFIIGEGSGADQITTSVGDATGINRRETSINARDLSIKTDSGSMSRADYIKQLQTKGQEKLDETVVKANFDGESKINGIFTYGVDYSIGDIVQCENLYGQSAKAVVTEYIISQDESGLSSYPTFKDLNEDE